MTSENEAERNRAFDEASRLRREAKRQQQSVPRRDTRNPNWPRTTEEMYAAIEDVGTKAIVVRYLQEGWTLTGSGHDWATMSREKGVGLYFGLARILIEAATRRKMLHIRIDNAKVTRLND